MKLQSLFQRSALTVLLCAAQLGAWAADTPIYNLQGSGASSPFVGQLVTTTGVVTKLNNNGFFIQDLNGDGNPGTSDGIFVFSTTFAPAVGSLVQVAGTLVEFNVGAASNSGTLALPLTEITTVTAVTVLGTGLSITPVSVSLPLAPGETLERFEGMLVRLVNASGGPLTVQQNFFQARFGQLTLGVDRHENPTNRHRPGSAQALALADVQARSRVLLDDGSSAQNRNPTPYIGASGAPRAGDSLAGVTGVLDFGLATASTAGIGLYRIHPTEAPTFTASNPRPATPPAVGGNLRVASMNVLNFFTTFTNGNTADGQTGQGCTVGGSTTAGNCRGANSLAEFTRQRSKIVEALAGLNADAVGLMEIQNNGAVAADNLVAALNAKVGAGTYVAVPDPAAGTGTDAIKVAMIFKPARLSRLGNAASDVDPVNNRPTLAQTFTAANGERFTLMVNHLKSKGSCPASGVGDVDSGDGQGCWNATRVAQAQRLRTFVAQQQIASASNDVLLIGDFNAYGQEDPIFELTSNGFIDQMGRFSSLAYSYVFDGTAGRIDHGITSATLSPKIAGAAHWHIDADESISQDYNLENKQPACATCAPDPYDGSVAFRASDHDPALLGVNLYKTITGTSGRDTLVGTPGDDILIGGGGADVLTGAGGNNIFVYQAVRDAGDTITDFVPGADRLDLRQLLANLGWTGTDPVAEGWLRFVPLRSGSLMQVRLEGVASREFRSYLTLSGVAPASLVPARDLIVR